MIKKNWIYLLFGISLIIFVASRLLSTSPKKGIRLQTMQIDNGGWGYEIYINDSLYIMQQNIPTIQGYKPFSTKMDAEKIGNLMIQKIKSNQHALPSITIRELDSCGIIY